MSSDGTRSSQDRIAVADLTDPVAPRGWMHAADGPGGTARCGLPATQRQLARNAEPITCPLCRR